MEHLVLGATAFLVTVLAVTALCRRFGLNAPLVLIVIGLLGSYLPFIHEPQLSPEVILIGALPPLLYASAVTTSLMDFRRNASAIGWLSVGLVLFTTAGVGAVVHQLLGIGWAASLAIGAVVAPPDAVAATAVARSIGLPRRVVSVLEGESLVNDATALVSLRTAIAAMGASVAVGSVLLDFLRAVVVAIVVGLVVAKLANLCFRWTDDAATSTALSLLVPFVAYVPAEELHGSGVLSVVVAGLMIGHASPAIQSGQTRLAQQINWHTVQFLLENAVFLLIGLQVRSIVNNARGTDLTVGRVLFACLATLLTVMVLRVVWVLGTRVLVHIGPTQQTTPARESAVISWAGMRGVVTLAAALTLPEHTPYRSVLILIALAATMGTLLIQGLTLPIIARNIGIHGPDPREDTLQEATIYQHAVAAGLERVRAEAGPHDQDTIQLLQEQGERQINSIWERLGRPEADVETPSETWRRLRTASIAAERAEVLRMRDAGQAEHEVLGRVLNALDMEEAAILRRSEAAERVPGTPLRPALPDSPCQHLAASPCTVEPSTAGVCAACEADGTDPVHLRLCLTCGHVGCCDSSVGMHATRHFEETGHPTMRSIEPGEAWRWCYVDEVLGGGSD
ncbi:MULTISPECIES: Na+/H+ antiporter [unclassified Luteococcus]|uniref:Na+/H+ antiporter n=1 Tax=unclassified Luteococcus TaxID=2639923 RepID=UPI00313BAFE2